MPRPGGPPPRCSSNVVQTTSVSEVGPDETPIAAVPGFARWDLTRPAWLAERFDLIVADPPFFTVSLRQLSAAVRSLAHHDPAQPLLVSYLVRREAQLLRAFAPFGLARTPLEARYATVEDVERNRSAFYGTRTGPDAA